jgi:hypothetical protein
LRNENIYYFLVLKHQGQTSVFKMEGLKTIRKWKYLFVFVPPKELKGSDSQPSAA